MKAEDSLFIVNFCLKIHLRIGKYKKLHTRRTSKFLLCVFRLQAVFSSVYAINFMGINSCELFSFQNLPRQLFPHRLLDTNMCFHFLKQIMAYMVALDTLQWAKITRSRPKTQESRESEIDCIMPKIYILFHGIR